VVKKHLGFIFAFVISVCTAVAVSQTPEPASMPTSTTRPATTQSVAVPTVVIELSGMVDEYNRAALFKRFVEARKLGAKTIILDVNTYGGAVTSGLEISQFIKQQSDLHTIAFVDKKAISAGIMIALAANELVMAPGAMIGDSAPIAIRPDGSMDAMPVAERAKTESPILADFYDSAMRNGYDPLLAEAMVSVGRTVYWVEKSGERKFVDEKQYPELKKEGWTDVPGMKSPVDAADTLLTVTTSDAEKLGLAKAVYPTIDALAEARNLTILTSLRPAAGEHIVQWLSSGFIRGLLLTLFSISMYSALHVPGHGAPEAIATISLGTFLVVPMLTGYAQWWEVVAVVLGLALIALEVFVIPGFGIPGITGIVLVLYGLFMSFVPLEPGRFPISIPTLEGTWQAFRTGLIVITSGVVASIALTLWLRRTLPNLPYFNKLILSDIAGGAGVMGTNPTLGVDEATAWPAVGTIGRAMSDLRPGGTAKFMDNAVGADRIANVVSDSGFVSAGASIVVREVSGNRVLVRAGNS